MEYQESGVIEVANDKGKFQSVKFRGRKEWFSNWLESNEPLKVGDVVNFNYTEKGIYKNIKNYEYASSAIAQAQKEPARSPEPSYEKADTVNEKETDSIKSHIKEITISRGQTRQFQQFEPTNFHVSVKAEYNESDNFEKICAILTEKVESELNRQIINKQEQMKENGS